MKANQTHKRLVVFQDNTVKVPVSGITIIAGAVDTTELRKDNSLSGDQEFGWLYQVEWMTYHPNLSLPSVWYELAVKGSLIHEFHIFYNVFFTCSLTIPWLWRWKQKWRLSQDLYRLSVYHHTRVHWSNNLVNVHSNYWSEWKYFFQTFPLTLGAGATLTQITASRTAPDLQRMSSVFQGTRE